jgi:hypothetical protein
MKRLNKLVASLTIAAIFGSALSNNLSAEEFCSDLAGCGYEECRSAPCLTPAIALGAVALVAIIAVAIQNSSGRSCHGHSHCD